MVDLDGEDVDAGELGGFHIGADGVDMAAGAGLAHDEEHHEEDHEGNPEGVVDAKELAVVEEVLERVAGFLAQAGDDGVGVAVAVSHVGNASGAEHGAQGGDEGRQLELAYQQAVDDTHHQTADNGGSDGNDGGDTLAHHGGGDHGGHGHHRADGQVNVAGDQDDTLTDAHQQVFRHGAQQVQHVIGLEDIRLDQAKNDVQDNPACEANHRGAHAANRGYFPLFIIQCAHYFPFLLSWLLPRIYSRTWLFRAITSPVMRPSHMTMIRSAMPMTSGISEETNITAIPCCFSWFIRL